MTRWGFDRKSGRKRRPNPLVRLGRAARRLPAPPMTAMADAPQPPSPPPCRNRPQLIDLRGIASSMELLAESWRKPA